MSSIDLSRFNFSGGENSAPIEAAGLALLGLLPHSGALPMTVAVLLVTVFSAAAAAVVSAAVNRFIPFSVGRPRR